MSILYGPDDRVWTKTEVEAETARRLATIPRVIPLFNGPHPMLDEEGAQDAWERVQRAYGTELAAFEREFMAPYGDENASGFAQTIVNTPGAYNDHFVKRNPISELDRPKDIYGVMNLSMRYAEDHYIVNRAIKVKKNFALRDMQVVHKNSTTVKHNTEQFRKLKIRQLLAQVFRYHEICGRVVVYWGYEFPIASPPCILDPRFVVVTRFLNKTQVLLKPHPRWVAAAKNPGSVEYKFLQANLPPQWMKYVKQNKEIPLDDHTYALIENDLSLFDTRGLGDKTVGGVPLSACFDALKVSKMLMASDFSTAWMMKNLITLISIGDPSRDDFVPPDQIELQKLQTAFQRPEYSLVAYVDPTVNIRFFAPGAEAMESKRYQHSTEEIEYVMGIPGVFTRGEGSYAAGSIGIKPFREDIMTMRNNVVDQLFPKLFAALREGYTAKKTGGSSDPDVVFDENCLKDDAVLFNELTGKWDRGAISNRALLAGRHGDFDMELQEKQNEAQYKDVLQPLFDVAHGNQEPSTGDASHEGGTGGAQPRPSRPR